MSVLYRYSPRRIARKRDGDHSIHDVVVHHTVIKRILNGSDNYAPVNLPHDAKVLRADRETVPLAKYLEIRSPSSPEKKSSNYQEGQEHLLNLVLRRQASYFLLLFALLLLVSMPIWEGLLGPSDGAWGSFFGPDAGALKYITPSYFATYLDCLHRNPVVVLNLIGFILLFYLLGNKMRDVIRDKARAIWIDPETSSRSRFRAFRFYHNLVDWSHNRGIYPAEYFGRVAAIMGFGFVLTVGGVALNRIWFNLLLGSGRVCVVKTELEKLKWLGSDEPPLSVPREFKTSSACWASGIAVEKGIAYSLRIDIDDP